MIVEVKASSCWDITDLIKKYGDKLKMFNATVDGIDIEKVTLPENEEECLEKKVEIRINSFEVIRDLIGTFGTIVMDDKSIEIYDDYRE